MDRLVDLTQVLASHPGSGESGPPVKSAQPADRANRGPAARPTPPSQSVPRSTGPAAVAPAQPSAPGELAGVASGVDELRNSWQAIVAEVRVRSRFLGEALAHTTPLALDPTWLTVSLAEPNQLFTDRLQAQAGLVEDVLQRVTGRSLRLRVTTAPPDDASAPMPRTLSEASIKADRLRGIRAKDPALDTAADALDLEIVD
jgi:hypothetical protein